ncbi:MAG: FGGY-family carbohydrate kinase [Rectinema subterraneum]|uniref:FGGY-family carbohydrate kinase n=1 Tax=Rectinema subterraneum TaxID=2653714 RepID=UPI003C7C8176
MAHYVIGIDAGTESFRAGVFDDKGHALGFGVSQNTTKFRHPGWAEQSPKDWEFALIDSIKKALSVSGVRPEEIEGVGIDGTSCTVVFLDKGGNPLRDAVMWMDIRATSEALDIAATGDAALDYVGHGNVSPEWYPCKVLWVKRNEQDVYAKAHTIFEQTDWLAYYLTGERTVNIDTITIRWFYNSHRGGFPKSLYSSIGLESVFDKIPNRVVKIGEVVGSLRAEIAEATGLRAGIPVAGGGADAYIGVIGVNALQAGKLALITGSSQLQIGISEHEIHAPGIFGSFPDAILDGLDAVEAGQISTGTVLRWFTSNFLNEEIVSTAKQRGISVFDLLNERAENIPPGAEGLVVLEHWQGNRTPWTDPESRGVIRGLTLIHGPAHIYRAIMEGIAYGTQVIIARMEEVGVTVNEIIACGGATQSPLWMQIVADVTNKKVVIPVEQQAVSLGSAIAAAVAAGIHPSLQSAAESMVKTATTYMPDISRNRMYKEYVDQYIATYLHLRDDSHKLVKLIGS